MFLKSLEYNFYTYKYFNDGNPPKIGNKITYKRIFQLSVERLSGPNFLAQNHSADFERLNNAKLNRRFMISRLKSPLKSLTHLPFIKSIAGIRSIESSFSLITY